MHTMRTQIGFCNKFSDKTSLVSCFRLLTLIVWLHSYEVSLLQLIIQIRCNQYVIMIHSWRHLIISFSNFSIFFLTLQIIWKKKGTKVEWRIKPRLFSNDFNRYLHCSWKNLIKKRKKVQHEFFFSSQFFVASNKDFTLSTNQSELQLLILELMLITYPLDNK
jgi:hypothetical protein